MCNRLNERIVTAQNPTVTVRGLVPAQRTRADFAIAALSSVPRHKSLPHNDKLTACFAREPGYSVYFRTVRWQFGWQTIGPAQGLRAANGNPLS
jgi:hypothetical protein